MSKIFINSSLNDEVLNDVNGIVISAQSSTTIPPNYYDKLAQSEDAIVLVTLPHITYNDGSKNLSINDAVLHMLGQMPTKIKTDVPIFADAGLFHFRGTKLFGGTVPAADASKIFEYTVLKEIFITGAVFKAFNSGYQDYFTLKIVAPMGHPAGHPDHEVILDEFVPSWGFDDTLQILQLYKAKLYTYFIIRIEIFHPDNTDLHFWFNAPFHEVVPV